MRTGNFGIIIGTAAAVLQAQSLDLRGRVLEADGKAVAGAAVELRGRGISTTTAADGSFSLEGDASIGPRGGRDFEYRLEPGILFLDVRMPRELRVEVFDGSGRRQGGFERRVEAGIHRISLAGAMPAPGGSASLLFLKLDAAGQTVTHPFFHPGGPSPEAVFGPARGAAAAKRAAGVDSLRIRKAGFRDLLREITGYTEGDLGDLVLTRSPDGEGICARQRPHRTSDGYDVVFCEAVHGQPPRVRLPAATATTAYAAMTAKGFVTPEGESYPLASSGITGAETRRYASALYEITLRNGRVEGFRPAVLFDESLFMLPLMGNAFEGRISNRTDGGRYGLPSLPVRVQVSAEPYSDKNTEGLLYPVKAAIANLTAAVASADGDCLPALSSHGAQAPFGSGTDAFFAVGRVPSMHAFGDDELVFVFFLDGGWSGSIMSREWFFTPLDLLKPSLAPAGAYSGVGHGTPGSIPLLELEPAFGGGGACTPD
jgi:hypothetical protein